MLKPLYRGEEQPKLPDSRFDPILLKSWFIHPIKHRYTFHKPKP